MLAVSQSGAQPKELAHQWEVSKSRLADWLAIVNRLDERNAVEILLDAIGDGKEDVAALSHRCLGPRWECGMCSVKSSINVSGA